VISDKIEFPRLDMNREDYLNYERQTTKQFSDSIYTSYKQFLDEISLLKDKQKYYEEIYQNKMSIKDYVLDTNFASKSVIRSVLSSIISNIFLLTDSSDVDLLSVENRNYMKYVIYNINNSLSATLLDILDELLHSILTLCDLSQNTKILSYYITMIVGLFLFTALLCTVTILLWKKKNNILNLLLAVNPKSYIRFTEICEEMLQKLKVMPINRVIRTLKVKMSQLIIEMIPPIHQAIVAKGPIRILTHT
jgi:hypothetical protein